jgi:hypothetical protein
MKRCAYILLFAQLIVLTGCNTVPASLSGRISTRFTEEPARKDFYLLLPDELNLNDRQIGDVLAQKMSEHGYRRVNSHKEATVVAGFRYSFGKGKTTFRENSGAAELGYKAIETTTVYPRTFEVFVFDVAGSEASDSLVVVWQGQLTSDGTITDVVRLAPKFLDELFKYFGTTVSRKSFLVVTMI